jgi:hypothetical protein
VIADGETADDMLQPLHLHGGPDQLKYRNITVIFPGRAAPHFGVAFDPQHQLDFWNHCEPPIF